jgi:POT family proton-dependent oligopeptide transporter
MTILQKNIHKENCWSKCFYFKIADALLTIIPLLVITYVLVKLFKQTFRSMLRVILSWLLVS